MIPKIISWLGLVIMTIILTIATAIFYLPLVFGFTKECVVISLIYNLFVLYAILEKCHVGYAILWIMLSAIMGIILLKMWGDE